jgi:hypothetical protein
MKKDAPQRRAEVKRWDPQSSAFLRRMNDWTILKFERPKATQEAADAVERQKATQKAWNTFWKQLFQKVQMTISDAPTYPPTMSSKYVDHLFDIDFLRITSTYKTHISRTAETCECVQEVTEVVVLSCERTTVMTFDFDLLKAPETDTEA